MLGNQSPCNGNKSKESIVEGLDNLIEENYSGNKKISIESFCSKSVILTKFEKKCLNLTSRIKPSKSNPILKYIYVINCLGAHQIGLL